MSLRSDRAGRVKLTVEVPRPLLERVKIRAVRENRRVWRIVTEALEAYLGRREKKGGAKS
jgi:hypothetical protein